MGALTQPAPKGLSERLLERALALQQSLWRETASRLRWWTHRAGRGDIDAADELQPPRLSDGAPHPEYASTWDDATGDWPFPDLDTDGYVWALELTTGANGDRWHLHRHVIVQSRSMAERVNAGWQMAVADLGIRGHGWARTQIDEVSAYYAAWYVAGYVAGKDETESVPVSRHAAYRRVMSGAQRYNAGGAARPLGIARPPSGDPVVAVEVPGYSERARDRIWPARDFFDGSAPCWTVSADVEVGDDWRPVDDWFSRRCRAREPDYIGAELAPDPLGTHQTARAP